MRMVQRGGRAGFGLKAPTVLGLRTEHRVHQLDRDRPVQPGIPAVADRGHAATPQYAAQLVAAAKNLWRLHT
jgi:hypothetical protein